MYQRDLTRHREQVGPVGLQCGLDPDDIRRIESDPRLAVGTTRSLLRPRDVMSHCPREGDRVLA